MISRPENVHKNKVMTDQNILSGEKKSKLKKKKKKFCQKELQKYEMEEWAVQKSSTSCHRNLLKAVNLQTGGKAGCHGTSTWCPCQSSGIPQTSRT